MFCLPEQKVIRSDAGWETLIDTSANTTLIETFLFELIFPSVVNKAILLLSPRYYFNKDFTLQYDSTTFKK